MSVENKYVDSNVVAGLPCRAANVTGTNIIGMATTFEVATADSDGSVYRLFKDIPVTLIPKKIELNADSITGGTDWDLGFYHVNTGAVIDKDSLLDGTNLNSGAAAGSEVNGLSALDLALYGSDIQAIINSKLSNTTKYDSVDICLTANTVGTAAGTISTRAEFLQG